MSTVQRFCLVLILLFVSGFAELSNDNSAARAEGPGDLIDSIITEATRGSDTGLPLPRFVSLKSSKTNMRIGPHRDHRVEWVFVRRGLPVEVIEEFEDWRRVRDHEGQEGWVHRALLSGERTVIVAPWASERYFTAHRSPEYSGDTIAKLQSGVQASLQRCEKHWCRIRGHEFAGWVRADLLWGVYPDEKTDN